MYLKYNVYDTNKIRLSTHSKRIFLYVDVEYYKHYLN